MNLMESEKHILIEKLVHLGVLPADRDLVNQKFPFFDHQLLSLIDYIAIRDILQLAGYEKDPDLFVLLMLMFRLTGEGSLCLNLEKKNLAAHLAVFMKPGKATKAGEIILKGLEENRWPHLISKNGDQYLPLVLRDMPTRKLLYFQKFFVHEMNLAARLQRLLATNQTLASLRTQKNKSISEIIDDLYSQSLVLRVAGEKEPITRDHFQIKALELSMTSPFSVISGGPGTGKTFLMVNMLRCLVRTGIAPEKILMCAPTGRAAQRMTEAVSKAINTIASPCDEDLALLNLKGATLHKALRYNFHTNGFYYNEFNPLPVSAVIVDEVSMVDVVMMDRLLAAVEPDVTRVIFLGDKDQLPSVEAGAVLSHMIPEGSRAEKFKEKLVVLENGYRSGEVLQQMAGNINHGKSPSFSPVSFEKALNLKPDQWAFVEATSPENWRNYLARWTGHHYFSDPDSRNNSDKTVNDIQKDVTRSGTDRLCYDDMIQAAEKQTAKMLTGTDDGRHLMDRLFQKIDSSRILTLVRKGLYGNILINQYITAYMAHRINSPDRFQKDILSGEVIMITRNDYAKELFNGDTGVVIKGPQGVFRAYFKRQDSYIGFSLDLLSAWEPAFALTVHKSQGSEFDDVLVVLPEDENHYLLTREMIYTAVTRARKRVIIYGSRSAFSNALKRKIYRESGLM
jgi:exodeoxyribonuclease V alpha subunit